jgi:hypothetical protein
VGVEHGQRFAGWVVFYSGPDAEPFDESEQCGRGVVRVEMGGCLSCCLRAADEIGDVVAELGVGFTQFLGDGGMACGVGMSRVRCLSAGRVGIPGWVCGRG